MNKRAIKFYNDFINALLKSNITPIVTLHHWDLPQVRPGDGEGVAQQGAPEACQGGTKAEVWTQRWEGAKKSDSPTEGCGADFTDVCK